MNAKSEFAPGRSERWRHPEPRRQRAALGSRRAGSGGGLGGVLNIPGTDAFRGHGETLNLQLRVREVRCVVVSIQQQG